MTRQRKFRPRCVGGSVRALVPLSILVLLFFWMACSEQPAAKLGDLAQDFTLPSLSGQKITLSNLRGRNVFLFFWNEGCVFCQTDHIVAVNDIHIRGKKSGLEVLSVNIAEPIGDVREFVQQKGLTFPVLLDRDAKVTRKKFGVYVVPTLFLIDRNGVIQNKAYGYLSEEGLHNFVEPYLVTPSEGKVPRRSE